jgi:predicted short-subunit dehydrogenase-like oxidoreductase (DUF2520 family)
MLAFAVAEVYFWTMRKLRFATVGLGAVGSALTPALAEAGHRPLFLVGRGRKREQQLARRLKTRLLRSLPNDIENIDFILVTIPTATLAAYAGKLATRDLPWKKLVFVHAAGPLGIEPFAPLAKLGAGVAAMHPYQTFPKRQRSVTLDGVIYGVTGDRRGARLARRIARELGGQPVMIKEADRVLYHLSAVVACGFTAANLEIAGSILAGLGIAKTSRERATRAIAEETIRNVKALGTRAAMTGPAARGDVNGVRRHLRELQKRRPELADCYEEMSRYMLAARPSRKAVKKSKRSK